MNNLDSKLKLSQESEASPVIVGQATQRKQSPFYKLSKLLVRVKVFASQSTRNKIITFGTCLASVIILAGGCFALYNTTRDKDTNPARNDAVNSGASNSEEFANPNNDIPGADKPEGSSNNSSGSAGSGSQTPITGNTTPVSFSAPIGYLGGSLTVNATDGYKQVGGTKFWMRLNYGGATIDKWAAGINSNNENYKYWNAFNVGLQNANNTGPTSTFWIQLLGRLEKTDSAYYSDAIAVISEVERRIPGVTVYVSAMNGYSPEGICNLPVGAPAQMRRVADSVVATGKAKAGPDVGDLVASDLEDNECHANSVGQAKLGNKLLSFFK